MSVVDITRLNTRLSFPLVAMVSVAAIPLGSNRPFFWALWAAWTAVIAGWYFFSVARYRLKLRIPFAALALPSVMFTMVAGAMAIQLLPMGSLLPIQFQSPSGVLLGTSTISLTPGDTWFALLRWLTYGLVFFLMAQVGVQKRRARIIAYALVGVVALEAAYALVALVQLGDTILFFDKMDYKGFATGTFINRNSLATFLGIGIVLSVALHFPDPNRAGEEQPRSVQAQLFLLTSLVLMISALMATQSRMGLLSSLAGIAVVVSIRGRGILRGWRGAIATVFGIAALAFLYGSGVAERLTSVEQAASVRLQLYRQILGMIAYRPLLGYGADSFEYAYPMFHELPVPITLVWDSAHSTYLSLWIELGVVIGSLPILIVACLLFSMVRARADDKDMRAETCAAIGASVLVAIHSLVDFSLEIQAVAMLFTALLALGMAKPLFLRAR